MSETKDTPPASSYDVGSSHFARAREGHRLLAQGKSLSEMKTPVIGSSSEELSARRKEYMDSLKKMTDEELLKRKQITMLQLKKIEDSKIIGASEFNWRNIVIDTEMEKRGLTSDETPSSK